MALRAIKIVQIIIIPLCEPFVSMLPFVGLSVKVPGVSLISLNEDINQHVFIISHLAIYTVNLVD